MSTAEPPPGPLPPRAARGFAVIAGALGVACVCAWVGALFEHSHFQGAEGAALVAGALAAIFGGLAWKKPGPRTRGWTVGAGAVGGGSTLFGMRWFASGGWALRPADVVLFLLGACFGMVLAALLIGFGNFVRAADSADARDADDAIVVRAALVLLLLGAAPVLAAHSMSFFVAVGLAALVAGAAGVLLVLGRDGVRLCVLRRIAGGRDRRWVLVDAHVAVPRPLPRYVAVDLGSLDAAIAPRRDVDTFREGALPEPSVSLDLGARLAQRRILARLILAALTLLGVVAVITRPEGRAPAPLEPVVLSAALLGEPPRRVDLGAPALDVVMDGRGACAVLKGGSVRCWGAAHGRFPLLPPVVEVPTELPGIGAVQVLALGPSHACATDEAGRVSCWGYGRDGQLGDGVLMDRALPVPVAGLAEVTALALDGTLSCARTKDGAVYCWGTPGWVSPSCAAESERRVLRPRRLAGMADAVELVAGHEGFVARDGAGRVFRWGHLGADASERCPDLLRPVEVALPSPAERISASAGACARLRSGATLCWGHRETSPTTEPRVDERLDGSIDVAVGGRFTCALAPAGTASCWGFALGRDAEAIGSDVPVAVPGLDQITKIAAGEEAACALRGDGDVWCWGQLVRPPRR